MSVGAASLDHVVVNTLRGMDEAAQEFAGLGFTLTPRGHHSLGSINHLMMTVGPYLELVGVPASGLQRRDVLDSPCGLNGLVLRSCDADETYARLRDAGIPALPPSSFSRPVSIDGRAEEARFRTVRISPDYFPAGRVYFCEHLTPEYVWRDEWFGHANGFQDIDKLVVASRDPALEADRYAAACGTTARQDDATWRIPLGAFTLEIIDGTEPRFQSLGLCFRSLSGIEDRAYGRTGASWRGGGQGLATLTLDTPALRLECRGAA